MHTMRIHTLPRHGAPAVKASDIEPSVVRGRSRDPVAAVNALLRGLGEERRGVAIARDGPTRRRPFNLLPHSRARLPSGLQAEHVGRVIDTDGCVPTLCNDTAAVHRRARDHTYLC